MTDNISSYDISMLSKKINELKKFHKFLQTHYMEKNPHKINGEQSVLNAAYCYISSMVDSLNDQQLKHTLLQTALEKNINHICICSKHH